MPAGKGGPLSASSEQAGERLLSSYRRVDSSTHFHSPSAGNELSAVLESRLEGGGEWRGTSDTRGTIAPERLRGAGAALQGASFECDLFMGTDVRLGSCECWAG